MRNTGISRFIPALFYGFLSLPLHADAEPEIAFVLKVTGEARVKSGTADWAPLQKGARLHDQDRIRTGAEALVAIVFLDDKTMMKIHAASEVKIVTSKTEKGLHKRIIMEMGQMWSKVIPGRGGYQVETPSGVAAVKGTEFYTLIDEQGETVIIGLEGLVEFFNEMGSVLVKKGETGRALKGSSPRVEPTTTFDDWAAGDRIQELDLEYRNEAGTIKHLKIRYK
ncbi:MAG TPA: FecR family protein [bacterium]|nr:FecR family protein [bacterium]HQG45810.1 FecR family protein [bacterium]HQI49285.1 FecR family protein [bacterium]HQJ64818.1 FecR family protein [bacterium]